jgi:hypothetical protein
MYCAYEKNYLENLTDLHVLSLHEYEKMVSGIPSLCLHIGTCMYKCTCSSLGPELLEIIYSYSVIMSSFTTAVPG